jgi:signal transduction histidine kinase
VAIGTADHLHSSNWRAARLIDTARLVLAIFSLLAVSLDATKLRQDGVVLQAILAAYAVYSLIILGVLLRVRAPLPYPIVRHVVDVLVIAAFLYRSSGPSSSRFPLLGFLLIAASVAWQSRGTLWTASGALLVFGATTLHAALWRPERFELNDEIIRAVSLIVMAALLVEFGSYEERVRRDLQRIVTGPKVAGDDLAELVQQLSQWTASVMGARRTLIAWTERDEPVLSLAAWEGGAARLTREVSGILEPLVVPVLKDTSFLCRRARRPVEPVLHMSEGGFARWHGTPLHPVVAQRFGVDAVLSVRFGTTLASGRLFVLDKPKMTSDDLLLGEIVARQVAHCLGEFYTVRRLAEDAVRDERMRVSRELHDGALNTLAGVGLELENLRRLPELKSSACQQCLREVQTSLEAEQRALRSVVERLRTDGGKSGEPAALTMRLRQLVERVHRQRGIAVEWRATDVDALPSGLADHLYFLLQEAVTNAVRHSGASTVWLEAERRDGQVTAVVSDNGRGFPFKGRYDLDRLISSRMGPTTLTERVAQLGGALVIDSSVQGTQVGISLKTGTPGA